jgi:transcriptional regulator with XRE-family HTH domain
MATVGEPDWDFSAVLRQRMVDMELTIERLAGASGVSKRTIQGWLREGRHPRDIPLARVESVVGDLGKPMALPDQPPSIELAIRRLRAAERSINEAKEVLLKLQG